MQLYSKTFGSGEPLIILHGLLGMSDNWQTFAKKISEEFMVFTPDMRNHGRSPHESKISYEVMVEDLIGFMESQWLYDGCIVLGHSMGGKIAMQLALTRPDLVKKLIVVDIAPVVYKPAHRTILDALNQIDLSQTDSRNQVRDELQEILNDQAVVSFLLKNLGRSKEGNFHWKMNLEAITEGYETLLQAPKMHDGPVDTPALFVSGGRSDYIGPDNRKRIEEFFPKSKIIEISEAGHWVHADQSDKFYDVIIPWLKES